MEREHSEIKWPVIIVTSREDVWIYRTQEKLDAEDASDTFGYDDFEVYDAVGRKGRLSLYERAGWNLPDESYVRLHDWEAEPTHATELEKLLRMALLDRHEWAPPEWSLDRLVAEAADHFC